MTRQGTIDLLLQRKSIRQYTDEDPASEVIETIVRCGQQAPFAAQIGSLLLSRDRKSNPFGAPLLFTGLVDVHRLERVMERRGWTRQSCDLAILLFGIQDAAYMLQNMVVAGEALGLGSCYLGAAPFMAKKIKEEYGLPKHVFPLVQMTMGYPAEEAPPRPRYPMELSLFEGRYPEMDDATVDQGMAIMDEGYLAQDYYKRANYMIPLEEGREETFSYETYSWTEHMGRKWGQWLKDPGAVLDQLKACGFDLGGADERA